MRCATALIVHVVAEQSNAVNHVPVDSAADARNVSRVMRNFHRSDEVLAAESDHAVYTVSNAISELSPLKYVSVNISNSSDNSTKRTVTSLLDSGAEICCLNADIAKDLSPTTSGQIQLRPFCGNAITADLARVTVSSCADVNAGCNKKIDWCAIVARLHDELILTSEAVDRLYECDVNVSHVADINATNINVAEDNDDVLETVVSVGNVDDVDDSDVREIEYNVPGSDVHNDRESDNDVFVGADDNLSMASSDEVAREQRDDRSLAGCWTLAERGKGDFLVKENLLYHQAKILGQSFLQQVVPSSSREHVLKMGHDTFGGHMSLKSTKKRILYTFYWPTLTED